MSRASIHALIAVAVIGASASMAVALEVDLSLRRDVDARSAPGQLTYSWKAKGTHAKGKERLDVLSGNGYVGSFGASFSVTAGPRDEERSPFFVGFYAPMGTGRNSNSTLKCRYDTRRDDNSEEAGYNLQDAAYTFQTLDDSITGNGEFGIKRKRAPVGMDGVLQVERVKSTGWVRRRRDGFTGKLKIRASGVITSGENADRPFRATLIAKLRDAEESERVIVIDGGNDQLRLGR